jgi:hypothetical protein
MWITLIVVALLLWAMPRQMLVRSQHKYIQTNTISHAHQIGVAMLEFEREFGRFPDQSTAAKVPPMEGMEWKLGDSSANDFFRQLIAAGVTDNETMFYADTAFSKKPDNLIIPGEKALAPGEVGFGYLMNGNSAFNTRGNPVRPLACAPLGFDGKTVSDRTFDVSVYGGRAVLLRIDNSTASLPILKSSRMPAIGGGRFLLDTGPDTVWGDSVTPVIVPPLPRR